MEHLLDPKREGNGTEEPASPIAHIAGNRLILDVYLDGCERFLQVTEGQKSALEEVEFLALNSHDEMITSAVTALPMFRRLKSLRLKGVYLLDENVRRQNGLLSSLPPDLSQLSHIEYLDLSFNSFTELPPCVTTLPCLSTLHLGYNQLRTLPDDICKLKSLTSLIVMFNQLTEIPASIGQLIIMKTLNLSNNMLVSLPEEIGDLEQCVILDLSENNIKSLPETLCNLVSLKQLILFSNGLVNVPAGLASLPHLTHLHLQNNKLRSVPIEITLCSCVRLQGNPIGEPEPSSPSEGENNGTEMKKIYVKSNEKSFLVTPEGCCVLIPGGFQLCFPHGAVSFPKKIGFQIFQPDSQHVRLGHHDVLLSSTLELQPHGIQFHQDVEITIPFTYTKCVRKREVVIRTFADLSETWTDLSTTTKDKSMVATCRTPHFSWFLVVSRLVEDRCEVPKEGELLFSTVDQNIRVEFPAGATQRTRTIRMQVLPVSKKLLREITGDNASSTSPLLCLSQSSTDNFLRPVKIQLPLPPEVKGNTLDRSHLFLLHGDPRAQTWTDITSQVVLQITHIYAQFQVDHFSWYWLWYTTKSYVGELAKTVYQRLRMYQVNFVALQRKRDPEQVLLQCVPKHKVDSTVKKLQDRYKGPEPSDLVELVEGEQFFAAFEQGLKLHSERPDCVNGKISFVFYAKMKNMKEVYVASSTDRKEGDVKGQVSFYRGSVPEVVPKEATKHRKGTNSDWMATLPIRLPKIKGLNQEDERQRISYSLRPLNLGNAEVGYLTETNLLSIATQIGSDWMNIGINLGLPHTDLQRIKHNNSNDFNQLVLDMLFTWAQKNSTEPDCIEKLVQAMRTSKRNDIADEIEDVIALGKEKYRQSIQRVGLDQGNSSEDSAIVMSQS
ncbi:PREDICTED: p53-induced death domain-containing protein 1 [Nanorana parkeri]|uniref:p53-induced death domain-containing protein 1 n=1 Tax=Nanorana parkeri TaxID=125878 RepID=UPI00085406F3|nr:PREDICTED: p53-induced death domain-containing protein 1 [Nanorana parkeri]